MLRRTHVQGESGRGYLLAVYLAAPARRTGVTRAMAVAGVILIAVGIGVPSMACAQAGSQGGAVGLLLLLAGGARREFSVLKQNPRVRVSDESPRQTILVKPRRSTAH